MKRFTVLAIATGLALSTSSAALAQEDMLDMMSGPEFEQSLETDLATVQDVEVAETATIRPLPSGIDTTMIDFDALEEVRQAAATNPSLQTLFDGDEITVHDIVVATYVEGNLFFYYDDEDVS